MIFWILSYPVVRKTGKIKSISVVERQRETQRQRQRYTQRQRQGVTERNTYETKTETERGQRKTYRER